MKMLQILVLLILLAAVPVHSITPDHAIPALVVSDEPSLFEVRDDEGAVVGSVEFVMPKANFRVRRIEITGNKVTQEGVILKQLSLSKGSLITAYELAASARRVEALGCFERGGVFWKLHEVSEGVADLELIVVEAQSRHLDFVASGFAPFGSMYLEGAVKHTNLFGRAWNVLLDVKDFRFSPYGHERETELSPWFQNCRLNLEAPCVLDSNVAVGCDVLYKPAIYTSWQGHSWEPYYLTDSPYKSDFYSGKVKESVARAAVRASFRLAEIDRDVVIKCEAGFEHSNMTLSSVFPDLPDAATEQALRSSLHKKVQAGVLGWIGAGLIKDTRNHCEYPTRGGCLSADAKLGLPGLTFGSCYMKVEAAGFYFLPLSNNEEKFVLVVGGRAGTVRDISNDGSIPNRDFILEDIGDGWRRTGLVLGFRDSAVGTLELQGNIPLFTSLGMQGRIFCDKGYGWVYNPRSFWVEGDRSRFVAGVGCSFTKGLKMDIDIACIGEADRTRSEQWLCGFVKAILNIPW